MGKADAGIMRYWFAWLVVEIGEAIDILKKKGVKKIMEDKQTREELIEELADCYMFLADILNRYKFSSDDFSKAYFKKMEQNFKRDYNKSKTKADKRRINN
jgi:NTP pyrophosphatase (non-canonical NTP hydrolase)